MPSPRNKLIKLNPHAAADDISQLGLVGTQKISIPVTGLWDGAGICIDASNNIFVSDAAKHVIYKYKMGAPTSKIFAGTYRDTTAPDKKGKRKVLH